MSHCSHSLFFLDAIYVFLQVLLLYEPWDPKEIFLCTELFTCVFQFILQLSSVFEQSLCIVILSKV